MYHEHRDAITIDGRSRDMYRIEARDYVDYAVGEDTKTAVIAAFKRRPPRNPEVATRAKTAGRDLQCVSTAEMLALAGY